jgi:hypothetical protein
VGEALIKEFENDFKKTVGAKEINMGDNDGIEVKIGEILFKIHFLRAAFSSNLGKKQ